jgi:chemotaxis protein methyltransferase CheR
MDNSINLTQSELEKLAEYLQKNIGIHLEAQKLLRFKRKIEAIFYKHDIKTFSAFYHQLRFMNSEELIQDLTNAVTVNETYFWREHEQFNILSKEVLTQLIEPSGLRNIRILVSPCSSGEELYSIMLSILDTPNLIDKLNIEMVGIDIDTTMIQKAKTGLYSKRSIDKLPKHLLEKYFTKMGMLYQIDKTLKDGARFMQANIFDEDISKKLGEFDILFSRNMLIYFNAKDKQRCFKTFWSLMKNDAKLFLGHADANNIDKTLFASTKYGFHIYRKIA